MLAADYSAWPFKNPAHSMTAAQRAYIIATREENKPERDEEKPLTHEELQVLAKLSQHEPTES